MHYLFSFPSDEQITLRAAFPQLAGNGPTRRSIEGKHRPTTAFPAVGWKNSPRRIRSWLERVRPQSVGNHPLNEAYSMTYANAGDVGFQPTAAALRVSILI